jgi:inhibitor of KinA sporulation pathway (predicted exonuclease)
MENLLEDFSFPTDPDAICDALYNTQTYFSRCVGYCTFHRGYLTSHQMKRKKCLQKNCDAFIKLAENEYWKTQEFLKIQKKTRKAMIKREKEFEKSRLHLVQKKAQASGKKANSLAKQKRYICLDLEMCELTSKQRKGVKGLGGEVIQIGAVMLDENFNYISEFSSLVKPVYGQISDEIRELTGISNESVEHADTFTTAFYKFFCWVGKDDITVFCWSDSDYKQLWDEIFIKARKHDEYYEFLRTFVDLQAVFGKLLLAEKVFSLDTALKLCHLKFLGQRHTALADSFNTARILYKINRSFRQLPEYSYICSYTETEMSKNYHKRASQQSDYTSSFASFVSPELLEKFGFAEKSSDEKNHEKNSESQKLAKNPQVNFITKRLLCTHYGVRFLVWMKFSVRMRFTGDWKRG